MVIVGVWNPAILSPEWVAKHIYDLAEGAEVPGTIELPMVRGAPARVKIRSVTYVTERSRLVLLPEDTSEDRLNEAETFARKTLDVLRHTPVSALGFNFEFRGAAEEQDVADTFADATSELVANLADHPTVGERRVGLTATRDLGQVSINEFLLADSFRVRFNFNYPLKDAIAVGDIPPGRFFADLGYASALIDAVFGLTEE